MITLNPSKQLWVCLFFTLKNICMLTVWNVLYELKVVFFGHSSYLVFSRKTHEDLCRSYVVEFLFKLMLLMMESQL